MSLGVFVTYVLERTRSTKPGVEEFKQAPSSGVAVPEDGHTPVRMF